MFGLREAYLSDQSGGTSAAVSSRPWSSVHFTANIVGNIGAPLTDGDTVDDSEWYTDRDEDRERQPPVVCDDPFAVGLIRQRAVQTTLVAFLYIIPDGLINYEEIAPDDLRLHPPPLNRSPQPVSSMLLSRCDVCPIAPRSTVPCVCGTT